jgi:hypothetical protein
LKKFLDLDNAVWIYSMWRGYLEQSRLSQISNPTKKRCGSFHPEKYGENFPNVRMLSDREALELE